MQLTEQVMGKCVMKRLCLAAIKGFVIGLVTSAILVLGGCSGYPRFDPASCWATEYNGDGSALWECE